MAEIISNSYLTATINPKGAELISLKSNQIEYIWEGNPVFWGKHAPILFPIIGTLLNNSYTFENAQYSLNRHGFARDLFFDVVSKKSNEVTFSLESNAATKKNYPFDFELQITYYLKNKELITQYKVINKSNGKMPFSIGAHPAFSLPNDFVRYQLLFDKMDNLDYYLLENDLLAPKTHTLALKEAKLPLSYSLFENDALVIKKLPSNKITILENEIPKVAVTFGDFPNLGIWTKVGAPFICIEPWFGYSDSPESTGNLLEKEGILILNSNQIFQSEFSIEIY